MILIVISVSDTILRPEPSFPTQEKLLVPAREGEKTSPHDSSRLASRYFSRATLATTGLGHNKPDYSCPTWQKLLVPFCIIQCKGWEIDEHMVGKYSRIIPDLNFVIE